MRKILVVGVSGSGKTTLSRRLAGLLGVSYTEVDALNHLPGWVEASNEQLRSSVEAAIAGSDGWVLDGGYFNKIGDLILHQADTVVWLDLPLPLVLRRLMMRTLRDVVTQRDLFNGNRQTLGLAFAGRESLFGYAIRQHSQRRREWPALFRSYPDLHVLRLRSPQAVEAWFRALT